MAIALDGFRKGILLKTRLLLRQRRFQFLDLLHLPPLLALLQHAAPGKPCGDHTLEDVIARMTVGALAVYVAVRVLTAVRAGVTQFAIIRRGVWLRRH